MQSGAAGDAVHEHALNGLQRDAHFLLRSHDRRAPHLRSTAHAWCDLNYNM